MYIDFYEYIIYMHCSLRTFHWLELKLVRTSIHCKHNLNSVGQSVI